MCEEISPGPGPFPRRRLNVTSCTSARNQTAYKSLAFYLRPTRLSPRGRISAVHESSPCLCDGPRTLVDAGSRSVTLTGANRVMNVRKYVCRQVRILRPKS